MQFVQANEEDSKCRRGQHWLQRVQRLSSFSFYKISSVILFTFQAMKWDNARNSTCPSKSKPTRQVSGGIRERAITNIDWSSDLLHFIPLRQSEWEAKALESRAREVVILVCSLKWVALKIKQEELFPLSFTPTPSCKAERKRLPMKLAPPRVAWTNVVNRGSTHKLKHNEAAKVSI